MKKKFQQISFLLFVLLAVACLMNKYNVHPGEPFGIDWQALDQVFVCHKLDPTSLPPFTEEAEDYYREGLRLWNTRNSAEDVAAARIAFTKGAELGHWKAMNNLAIWARLGRGGPQDYELTFQMYRNLARQGAAIGYHSIGVLQQNGHFPFRKPDLAKAMRRYEQAALRGYAHSQVLIGTYQMYNLKREPGGLKWLHCADSQNYGPAATAIGRYTKIVERDYKLALVWYLRGGSLGDKGGGSGARILLRKGRYGIPKDLERSKCISKYMIQVRKNPNKPIGDLAKLCPPSEGL